MRQLTCLVVKLPAETNAHLPEQEVALENAVRGLLAKLMPPNPNSSNLRSSIPVSYVYTEAMGSEGTLNAVVPALEWSLWRIRESSREFRSE
ncbi:hypothetical protein BD309DRAFT_528644 [Dichomitus squalens]|nr:hypothetical protein BD309DRAFT_528644 [Dichomitus squalens]TBU54555.1 hypothetical protein BD310DRAFT_827772 [Dichomitus squalens]